MRNLVCLLLAFLMLGLTAGPGHGQDSQPVDPALVERRTEAISKTLRCVVCQNQSIHDSNAPLATDMRRLVEKRVIAGDSDAQVREYLRVRYGDFVLMRPPFQANTLLLWFGPALLVLLGGVWFVWRLRGRSETPHPARAELGDTDRARVQAALSDQPASQHDGEPS